MSSPWMMPRGTSRSSRSGTWLNSMSYPALSARRYSITEGEWADDDGRILLRNATTDSYEGRLRVLFGNAACLAPNRNFTISSIKLNTGIDAINVF